MKGALDEGLKTAYNDLPKSYVQTLLYLLSKLHLHLCHLLASKSLITGLEG